MVAKGDVTPNELLDAALAKVAAVNPALNAVFFRKTASVKFAAIKTEIPLFSAWSNTRPMS
jgi:Asp-tRNA(Asn)/Glu-tRNA(Gln) amidotransferase A subunit family amidase